MYNLLTKMWVKEKMSSTSKFNMKLDRDYFL